MILITSDLQLSAVARDAYRFQFVEKTLPELLKKYKAKALYVLGDLTEDKDNHGSVLVNRVSDAFYELAKLVDDIVILAGNHDYVGSEYPFFNFLDMVSNVRFATRPRTFGDGHLFLPHTSNYKRDWGDLLTTFKDYRYIFSHNTFEGTMVNKMALPGIPTKIFPAGIKVVSGDIHTPQTVDCVTYVGAPYTVDFGDDYEPRLLVLDRERLISVPVPGPQKRLLVLDRHGQPLQKRAPNIGDILKLRVEVQHSDYARWSEMRSKLRDVAEQQGFIVHTVEPVVIGRGTAPKRKPKPKQETDDQLLRRYAQHHGIDDKTLEEGLKLL